MLSACGQKRLRYSRYSNRLNHYEERLRKTVKRSLRKDMLYEMMAQDVITKKYKVSDDDVDKRITKAKNQYGDQFKNVLKNNGLKDEADFKNQIKFKLAMNEAIKKSITEKDVKRPL